MLLGCSFPIIRYTRLVSCMRYKARPSFLLLSLLLRLTKASLRKSSLNSYYKSLRRPFLPAYSRSFTEHSLSVPKPATKNRFNNVTTLPPAPKPAIRSIDLPLNHYSVPTIPIQESKRRDRSLSYQHQHSPYRHQRLPNLYFLPHLSSTLLLPFNLNHPINPHILHNPTNRHPHDLQTPRRRQTRLPQPPFPGLRLPLPQ